MRLVRSRLPYSRRLVGRPGAHAPLAPCLVAACVLALAGCAHRQSTVAPSEGHIRLVPQAPGEIPPPVRTTPLALPAPKPTVKLPTYSVVVNDVPVKELLLALARDTKQNIDIHPGLTGVVSLNAINETLPAILERIAKQVNMRVRHEGNTIIVQPDTPYLRTYRINYVNLNRDVESRIGVSGQVGSGVAGGRGSGTSSGTAPGTASTAGNSSETRVQSQAKNNFWELLQENVRQILASSRPPAPGETRNDVVANPMAGTLSVFATERQHQLVQQHIDSVTQAAQRQVLIEATIVEVRLNDRYRAGVDWSRLRIGGGLDISQSLTGGNLSSAPSFVVGYVNPTSRLGDISVFIRLLEQFGTTRVLSSPKLMALNNQTALLKVVDNTVYFTIEAQAGTIIAGGAVTPTAFTTTVHTVPVGVVMSVTPQINENGQVTISVRPTITRIVSFRNDPNPALAGTGITNAVPEIQMREMESVLQVGTGQTVVLGGLMQDDIQRARDQVPGLGSAQGTVGELFAYRDDQVTRTELIIFIKPTVITNPSLQSDELKFFQRFLPQAQQPGSMPRIPTGGEP